MLLLRRPEDGAYWVLTFVTTVALIDSAGYLFGRVFGKHKLAPGVSPKKTWEGLLASIVLGSATAITLTILLLQGPWWVGLILAAAIILAAVFGDLAESLIKRDLGVKDMSKLLPGHGGMMDRLDSMLPASLMSYLVMVVFFG
jgi:phosphatidate cytidylyltransferase